MKIYLCLLVFVITNYSLLVTNCFSQWSSDSTVNLQVCDLTGEQSLPKIAMTTDGGCYISWFDTRSSTYNVYLQRLSSSGVKQFGTNGLLISSNPEDTWITDYDMKTDNLGNAIIVFSDIRYGGVFTPFAYKIGPDGSFLWGPNGIALSDSSTSGIMQASPRVAVTSDGNYVFIWNWSSDTSKIALQKLSSTGTKLWGSTPVLKSSPGEDLVFPSIVPSDNGSIIAVWKGFTGNWMYPTTCRIYTSKLSQSGNPLWSNPQDTVYTLGEIPGYAEPQIYSDGSNGAFYNWMDFRNNAQTLCSYVQHINSAGTKLFPVNGAETSSNSSNWHIDASVSYMPATGETFLFWKEANFLQTQFGFYGQKFSASGSKLWGDYGKEFIPLSPDYSFVTNFSFVKDTSVIVFLNQDVGSNDNYIKAFKVNRNGDYLWSSGIKKIGASISSKVYMEGYINSAKMSVIVWSDDRMDLSGIYSQNINYDGTLGGLTNVENNLLRLPVKYELLQNYPNPFNPSTKIRFEIPLNKGGLKGVVTLKVYDILGKEIQTLVNEQLQPGTYEVTFDGGNMPSGVYFYQLRTNDFVSTKKLILLK